jgi:hypothetical protein
MAIAVVVPTIVPLVAVLVQHVLPVYAVRSGDIAEQGQLIVALESKLILVKGQPRCVGSY